MDSTAPASLCAIFFNISVDPVAIYVKKMRNRRNVRERHVPVLGPDALKIHVFNGIPAIVVESIFSIYMIFD